MPGLSPRPCWVQHGRGVHPFTTQEESNVVQSAKRNNPATQWPGVAMLCAGLLIAGWAGAQSPAGPYFDRPVDYGVGDAPIAIVAADFDGDSTLDLAVSNQRSNTITLLRGQGAGRFSALPPISTGRAPVALAAADINYDGNIDLAVANLDDNEIAIFLGQGTGSFRAGAAYPTGESPVAIGLADFNGDGVMDCVAANRMSDDLSVRLGRRDGRLGPETRIAAGQRPTAIALADLDGDGALDLLAANYDSDTLSVFRGNGNGSFQDGRAFGTGRGPAALAIGDMNGDSILDAAVANTALAGGSLSLLSGTGTGSFRSAPPIAEGDPAGSVWLADFNRDQLLDIAFTRSDFSAHYVSVLLGAGGGTFEAPRNFPTGALPVSLAVADFNDDGHLDIATANHFGDSVSVLLGRDTPPPAGEGEGEGEELSPAEIAERLLADFELFDADMDGFLSLAEALLALPSQMLDTIEMLDINDDGLLSPAELGGLPDSESGGGCLPKAMYGWKALSSAFLDTTRVLVF